MSFRILKEGLNQRASSQKSKISFTRKACRSDEISDSISGTSSKDQRDTKIAETLGLRLHNSKADVKNGADYKHSWLNKVFFQDKLDIMGIQESKMERFDVDEKINFICIYGPQSSHQKEALWAELSSLMASSDGVWVWLGDFNVVRSASERARSVFEVKEAFDFNNFISSMGFHDFQMGGSCFTWFNMSGSKMSKVDRFLVSSNFFEHWENASVIAVDRVISDHNPIMLSIGSCDFGPKPFRFFDCWFGHLDFESVVEKSWKSGSYRGTPDIVLKNKIKQLRYDIKEWNIRCSTERHKRRDEILARLCDWDAKAEGGIVTPIDINRREEDRMEIQKIDHLERRIMKQKARIKWAIEGDENSHFFHNYVKKNARKNNIGLVSNGEWVTNPMSIKDIVFNHFSARFKESCQSTVFDSNLFRMLNEVDVNFLESEFSKEDIKAAVWDCSGSKAPGPDGLNFKFIKRFWDLIQDDFISCIKHFESSSHLGRGFNPSFISLIPKCKDPI
ncbi:putative RNA-directed DNA polymerase, partial [Tanacetum coccineum]